MSGGDFSAETQCKTFNFLIDWEKSQITCILHKSWKSVRMDYNLTAGTLQSEANMAQEKSSCSLSFVRTTHPLFLL